MRRVIIAGGRDFDDYTRLRKVCDEMIAVYPAAFDHIVVSGCANGADSLGIAWAVDRGADIDRYPADWYPNGGTKLDRGAGHKRNERMAQNADMLIAFWDGKSPGTKSMIDLALKYGLEVHVYRYGPGQGQGEERF